MDTDERKLLEHYIERHGLQTVVSELSNICSYKGMTAALQQDTYNAKIWLARSVKLDEVALKLE